MRDHNNFDFIRVAAALMVLVSHQFALMGRTEPNIGAGMSLGWLGVCIFFSISGYLVTLSWQHDPHIVRFVAKRFLRVWPGLFVAICICALVLGPLLTTLHAADYFSSHDTWRYFQTARLKMQYDLPGVFSGQPFSAVNGSLWTIPLEVRWYLILLIAGAVGLMRVRWLALGAVVILVIYQFGFYHGETNPNHNYAREFGVFFCSGVCAALFRDFWKPRAVVIGAALLTLSVAAAVAGHVGLAIWIILPFATVAIGASNRNSAQGAKKHIDISYGIYIYAFPTQQTLIWIIGSQRPLLLHLALSIAATVALAMASWYLVERPALHLKDKHWPRNRDAIRSANASGTT